LAERPPLSPIPREVGSPAFHSKSYFKFSRATVTSSGHLRMHTPVLSLLSSQSRFPPSVHFPDGRIPTQRESRFIWLPQRRRSVPKSQCLLGCNGFPHNVTPPHTASFGYFIWSENRPRRASTLLGILQVFFVDRNFFLLTMGDSFDC